MNGLTNSEEEEEAHTTCSYYWPCGICNTLIPYTGSDPTCQYEEHLSRSHDEKSLIACIVKKSLEDHQREDAGDGNNKPLIDVACEVDLLPNVPKLQKLSKLPLVVKRSILPMREERAGTLVVSTNDAEPKRQNESVPVVLKLTRMPGPARANKRAASETISSHSNKKPKLNETNQKELKKPVLQNDTLVNGGLQSNSNNKDCVRAEGQNDQGVSAKNNPEFQVESSSNPLVKKYIPWYSGCEYQCGICNLMFHYVGDLRNHVKIHGRVEKYLQQFNEFETKAVYWTCVLCKSSVKRNYAAISNHLKKFHSVDLHSFHETHNFPYFYEIELDISFVEKPTPNWFDGCEYQCQYCKLVFYSRDTLLNHALDCHNLSKNAYRGAYKKFITSEKLYKCKICDEKFRWEKEIIEKHLRESHGGCELEIYGQKYHSSHKASSNQQCYQNSSSPKKKPDKDVEALETFKAGSCLFKCQVCQFESQNKPLFDVHLKETHHWNPDDYSEKHGDPCIKKTVITCKICKITLLHEYSSIHEHLQEHNLSIEEYFEKNCKNGFVSKPIKPDGKCDIWINKCSFTCTICNKRFKTKLQTSKHQKFAHGKIQLSKIEPNLVRHKCKLCDVRFLHCRVGFAKHFSQNHRGLTLKTYFERFIENTPNNLKDLNTTKSKKEKENGDVKSQSRTLHQTENKESSQSSLSNQDDEVQTHQKNPRFISSAKVWAQGHKYVCKICTKKFQTRKMSDLHIKKVHKLPRVGNIRVLGKIKCQICSHFIRHSVKAIIGHLKQFHEDMELEQYHKKYILGDKAKSKTCPQGKSGESKKNKSKDLATKKSNTCLNTAWANRPEFKCILCKEEFTCKSKAAQHLRAKHKTEDKNGILKPIEKRRYKCQLCDKKLIFKPSCIAIHMKTKHSLSLSQYRQKTLVNQRSNSVSVGSDTSHESDTDFQEKEIAEEKLNLKDGLPSETMESLADECSDFGDANSENEFDHDEKVSKRAGKDVDFQAHSTESKDETCNDDNNGSVDGILAEEATSHFNSDQECEDEGSSSSCPEKDWMNGCKYQCKICDQKLNAVRLFKKHIVKDHQMDHFTYEQKYKESMILMNIFRCQECNEVLKHDPDDIVQHLHEVHQMSPGQYYARFFLRQEEGPQVECEEEADASENQLGIIDIRSLANEDFDDINSQTGANGSKKKRTLYLFQWNQCKYLCQACYMTFNCNQSAISHCRTKHEETGSKYIMMKHLKHSCLLCSEEMKFEAINVTQHLMKKHGNYKLITYERDHFQTLKSIFKAQDLPLPLEQEIDAGNSSTVSAVHGSSESNSRSPLAEPPVKKKRGRPKKIRNQEKDEGVQAKSKCREKNQGNENLRFDWNPKPPSMRCVNCHEHFSSFLKFSAHKGRNVNCSTYNLIKYKNHTCLICNIALKFDIDQIIAHLTLKHLKTLKEYEDEFYNQLRQTLQEKSNAQTNSESPASDDIENSDDQQTLEGNSNDETNFNESSVPHNTENSEEVPQEVKIGENEEVTQVHEIKTEPPNEQYDVTICLSNKIDDDFIVFEDEEGEEDPLAGADTGHEDDSAVGYKK